MEWVFIAMLNNAVIQKTYLPTEELCKQIVDNCYAHDGYTYYCFKVISKKEGQDGL